jgi:endoglycosylceramidase
MRSNPAKTARCRFSRSHAGFARGRPFPAGPVRSTKRQPSIAFLAPVGALAALSLAVCSCGTISGAADYGGGSSAGPGQQYSSPTAIKRHAHSSAGNGTLDGLLDAPGGPYIKDRAGRVVLLHGVDAVYKLPPFELYPDPGKSWNFSEGDAARIADLGFNVVRLGILWQGLEPGQGGSNQPKVCTSGHPDRLREMNRSLAMAYLARVARTVDMLGRHHIYTILDMHQDVYNQAFDGEGAPSWAVCTDGIPPVPIPGRWSRNYDNPALDIAVNHFWENNVIGNLQGQFDQVWGLVAHYFEHNPWIAGYDPYNEPFSVATKKSRRHAFAVALDCFYTGRLHPAKIDSDRVKVSCPPDDPLRGVVPTIEAADPHHLVFVEPDIYSDRGRPDLLGSMPFPRLVLNFHAYCPDRSPLTGDPLNVNLCAEQDLTTLLRHESQRPMLATAKQPGGPAWFLSEFGATQNRVLLTRITGYADLLQLGWAYWAWKRYDDPTGSQGEALVSASGGLGPGAPVLSRTYAEAIAGTPVSTSFDPRSGAFSLVLAPNAGARKPTLISVSHLHYPHGYCTTVDQGRILSVPGADELLVANDPGSSQVTVKVLPGRCSAPHA